MNQEIAICAENVGKYYRLGQFNSGMLYKDIQSWIARKTGREDPHSRLGTNVSNAEGFWALKDINIEVFKGDRIGIIGRNGAGKSTLLKIVSQVTAPTTGKIGVNGRMASLLEVGTGFHPEMTGRENIYLNGAILGMKRSEINEKIKDIIEFSEIDEHIDTPVKRYSSGMYVRLAFAVAAHLESEILIADEVLAVGDAAFQKKALGKMGEISNGQGRTVLFVSHQMNSVKALCDKGIVLDHGQIAFNGPIDKCINFYQKDLLSKEKNKDFGEYGNEFIELLDFDLVNDEGNSIVGGISSNDNVGTVVIDINVKKLHTGLNVGYALYSNDGNLVFWSVNTDVFGKENPLKIGHNILSAPIPNHFLNEGDYSVYLIESIHQQEWLVNPEESSPKIPVRIEGGLSESPFWILKRPGVCAPVINWKYVNNK